jgi:hypothetical protein
MTGWRASCSAVLHDRGLKSATAPRAPSRVVLAATRQAATGMDPGDQPGMCIQRWIACSFSASFSRSAVFWHAPICFMACDRLVYWLTYGAAGGGGQGQRHRADYASDLHL